ncbi:MULTISPECIES: MFS transporter [unclassified Streptococcus]|uniref:MFS transporter n=1 Tax=unclassified Streptococcus TaxID=2608887 RepID=UPI0018AB66F4|nr:MULTISPECIES: MFS transporter [unclassified Streptococcus]MBF8969371.1 MFS transporter [Streptococcus sp. NLN76]MBG9366788.1 MFS transporter [Streptococcus sp. NLN64]
MLVERSASLYFRYFLMYTFFYLSWALFSAILSIYMLDLGYSASQVSLVVSVSFLTSVLSQPVLGYLNDRLGIKPVTLAGLGLALAGGIIFLLSKHLWGLVLGYSLAIMMINGINPVMDLLAARSPYKYGSIRVWGTIGYATGTQMAGILYQMIHPQAIYVTFLGTLVLSIIGVLGLPFSEETAPVKEKQEESFMNDILKNRPYLLALMIIALFSGVANVGHTYIPAMLEASGLSVSQASTVVSLAVICEAPLIFYSYLFMDRYPSKILILFPIFFMTLQFVFFGLAAPIPLKIFGTLLAKHAANMTLIMLTLKLVNNLVGPRFVMTGMALIQTAKSLLSILVQTWAGWLIDTSGYESMSWFMVGLLLIVLLMVPFLHVDESKSEHLFS